MSNVLQETNSKRHCSQNDAVTSTFGIVHVQHIVAVRMKGFVTVVGQDLDDSAKGGSGAGIVVPAFLEQIDQADIQIARDHRSVTLFGGLADRIESR